MVKKQYESRPEEGKKYLETTLGNISLATSSEAAVADTDLVIEAIVENLDRKKALFSGI